MKRRFVRILSVLMICLLLAANAGCAQHPQSTPSPSATPPGDYLIIDPEQRPVPQRVILYYKHNMSGFLVPVTGTVNQGDASLGRMANLVLKELLKGPQGSDTQTVGALIPEGTQVSDVTMTGSTAFVYFNTGITGNIPIVDAYANQDQTVQEQRNRELLLYSIVNTLTALPGIANVKILIDNHFATYTELGLTSLAQIYGADPDTSMPSFGRSVEYILQPDDVVLLLMTEWSAEKPIWDKIYPFLYANMTDGSSLPGREEMEGLWSGTISRITVDTDSIVTQEIRGDNTALVAVSYQIDRTNGQKQPVNLEYLHLISQGGVWKLVLPPHLLNEDYGY